MSKAQNSFAVSVDYGMFWRGSRGTTAKYVGKNSLIGMNEVVWVVLPVITIGFSAVCMAFVNRLSIQRSKKMNRRKVGGNPRLAGKCNENDVEGETSLGNLSNAQLINLIGKAHTTYGLEKHQLVTLAERSIRRRSLVLKVIGSSDLAPLILKFLHLIDVVSFSGVCKACDNVSENAQLWETYAIQEISKRYLCRLDQHAARQVIYATKQSFDSNFFKRVFRKHSNGTPSWKTFLSNCKRLEKNLVGGFGNAVIVPRSDVSPHHILRFIHLLSIRKHSSCTIRILQRFLQLYHKLRGELNGLRGNVGYCFPIVASKKGTEGGGQESMSHQDFMEVSRASNLQVIDLLAFYESQTVI